ncbi:MAG: hypothetical protein ABSG41_27460 [Bryobacteraceae bacterium]|jgi:hypothetical protein
MEFREGFKIFAATDEPGNTVRFTFESRPGFFVIDRSTLNTSTVAHAEAAERYQREFDEIMRRTELHAERAARLHGVDNLEQLFEAAKRVGIDQSSVWKIIERDPSDTKSGLLARIGEIRERTH